MLISSFTTYITAVVAMNNFFALENIFLIAHPTHLL